MQSDSGGAPGPAGTAASWRPTRILPKDTRYASWIAFFAWVFSVYDFILFGTLLPEIRSDFGWSEAYAATLSTLVSVGTFVFALLVGPLIDRVGRRMALIVTTAGAAISSGLTGLTPAAAAAPWLVGARSASGLGYSEQAVNSTYLNELYASVEGDKSLRGRRGFIYSLVQGGWPIGVLFAAAMTSILLPIVGWRGVFLVATFPAIVIVIVGRRLRESPKYEVLKRARELTAAGRRDEAAALAAEYRIDIGAGGDRRSYAALAERPVRRHTAFLAGAFLLNWFGIQVLNVLSTTILTDGKGITFSNSLLVLILSNAVGFIGYMTFGWIGDRVGRRNAIAAGWACAGVCYLLMLFAVDGYWPVVVLNSLGLFFLIGPYSALLFYMGESYPTRWRASGAAFVNAMGPIGAIVGGAIFSAMLSADSGVITSAAVAGAIPVLISGALMLGARNVKPDEDDPLLA
jgi:putative MFS transporter